VGLAAFYLIPMACEQHWVDLSAAVDYPVFKIENNWLFAHHAGAGWIPFDAFLHRASSLTVITIGIALSCVLVLIARNRLLHTSLHPPYEHGWSRSEVSHPSARNAQPRGCPDGARGVGGAADTVGLPDVTCSASGVAPDEQRSRLKSFIYKFSRLASASQKSRVRGWAVVHSSRNSQDASWIAPDERRSGAVPFPARWWMVLAMIPLTVLLLQFPFSLAAWNVLPKLRFLQYPWRWTLVVEAPMALFFAAAVWPAQTQKRWQRAVVAATCGLLFFASLVYCSRNFLRVCKQADTAAGLLAQYRAGGLRGADEYEPPEADHWKIARALPDACFSAASDTTLGVASPPDSTPTWAPRQGSCEATAAWSVQQPQHLRVKMSAPHAGYLILKLVSFPAWRVRVNGLDTDLADPRDDGLIAVPVAQGAVDLAVDWVTTPDGVAGRVVSAASFLLLVGITILRRRRAQLHQT
jgi:hypothetical protein